MHSTQFLEFFFFGGGHWGHAIFGKAHLAAAEGHRVRY